MQGIVLTKKQRREVMQVLKQNPPDCDGWCMISQILIMQDSETGHDVVVIVPIVLPSKKALQLQELIGAAKGGFVEKISMSPTGMLAKVSE